MAKDCEWCGSKIFKSREHTCPEIFIRFFSDKIITIRGNFLDVGWKGDKIIIKSKEAKKKNGL